MNPRALFVAALLALASCGTTDEAKSPGPGGRVRHAESVATRLEAVESEHRLGKPMRFNVHVEWTGDGAASIDTQDASRPYHLIVTGPDGPLVYHGWRGSTVRMGDEMIKDGGERELIHAQDILQSYTIDKPGRYRVQFEGADSAFGVVKFPPSNVLEIDVR